MVKARAIVGLGISFFLAMLLACCAPVALRLAAPVCCPDGYARSAAVADISNPEPGTTNVDGNLYCIDRSGVALRANWGIAVLTLGVEAFALVAAVGLVLAARSQLSRRVSP